MTQVARTGRITEAVNPANEVIDVRRVGTRPMAPSLLHDSQQCLRQGHWLVTEVEEVVGEEDPAPAQVGALVLLAMPAWAKRRGEG
jgi:hypothetical protein